MYTTAQQDFNDTPVVPDLPRILVVDDDEIVIRAVIDTLEDRFKVTGTKSPEKALGILKEVPHEILLTDLMMGEMYGLDFIKAVKSISPDTAVIIITGYANKETAIEALKEGVYDFLEKPLSPDIVIQTIIKAWKVLELKLENHRLFAELKQTNEKLLQSQKMEAIGTLAGGIAHDFNNILSPIMGYAELAFKELHENSRGRRYLNEVYKAATRAKGLVQQILTFSHQTEHKKKPLKVQLVVKEALKFLRASIPTNIKIRRRIVDGCSLVLADPVHIYQVAINLCTNAYHAMEGRGGNMTVGLTEVTIDSDDHEYPSGLNSGDYVLLRVSDTGHGMDHSIMERIFDPYFTTKQPGKGTGMGLATVHGIVKSCGGDIRVYSDLNKGTTFEVYLPSIDSDDVNTEIVSLHRTQKGTEHILFVDDETVVVQMEKRRLEGLGYKVTERVSSVEALGAFRAAPGRFNLVITDMTMPDMTGMELARELIQIRPDISIILCTGFSHAIDEDEIARLGIKGLLMKPVTIKELSDTIRRVLEGV